MEPDRKITFEGAITFEQYRRGMSLHHGRLFRGLTWTVVAVLVGLALLVATAGLLLGESPGLPLGIMGFAGFFVLMLALFDWSLRRAWKTHKLLGEPVRGSFSDEGFAMESELGKGLIPWDRFYQWSGSPEALLVYQSTRLFHILPREFFDTDADWNSAHALVAAKLPSRTRKRRWRRLWYIVAWLVIFLTVLLVLLALQ